MRHPYPGHLVAARKTASMKKLKPGEEGTVIDICPGFWKFLGCPRDMQDQVP
jgi:hypothetical protein